MQIYIPEPLLNNSENLERIELQISLWHRDRRYFEPAVFTWERMI